MDHTCATQLGTTKFTVKYGKDYVVYILFSLDPIQVKSCQFLTSSVILVDCYADPLSLGMSVSCGYILEELHMFLV